MADSVESGDVRQLRALFLSDVHLGMRPTRIGQLVDFLKHHDAETIYLIGDIVDGWRLAKSWYWPPIYNEFVEELLDKAGRGTRIVVLPGNHDEFLREYLGTYFGEVEFVDRTVHTTAQGKTYLVIHGDQFDVVVRHAKWLAHVGDWAYRAALRINIAINWIRRRLGLSYWSLSAWAKAGTAAAASKRPVINALRATIAKSLRILKIPRWPGLVNERLISAASAGLKPCFCYGPPIERRVPAP